jgi:hypothetical protein
MLTSFLHESSELLLVTQCPIRVAGLGPAESGETSSTIAASPARFHVTWPLVRYHHSFNRSIPSSHQLYTHVVSFHLSVGECTFPKLPKFAGNHTTPLQPHEHLDGFHFQCLG